MFPTTSLSKTVKIRPPPFIAKEEEIDVLVGVAYFCSRVELSLVKCGDMVYVLKSRSRSTPRPFAPGIVEKKKEDGRILIRYNDSSSYAVRPCHLVPIQNGILVCRTTSEYRFAATTQPKVGELALEIGCDTGETLKRLHKATMRQVIGIDKAAVRIEIARKSLCTTENDAALLLVCDILRDPILLPARPDVIFLDVNGSRDYSTVSHLLQWIRNEWRPRLLVIKSVQFVQKHFPAYIPSNAPHRQRAALPTASSNHETVSSVNKTCRDERDERPEVKSNQHHNDR